MDTKTYEMIQSDSQTNGIRTVFIFLEIPYHYELQAGYLPILNDGLSVDFDIEIKCVISGKMTGYEVRGVRTIKRKSLKYNVKLGGLCQFIEWATMEE